MQTQRRKTKTAGLNRLVPADIQHSPASIFERREQEVRSAGNDERNRKKLDDDLTPLINITLVVLRSFDAPLGELKKGSADTLLGGILGGRVPALRYWPVPAFPFGTNQFER